MKASTLAGLLTFSIFAAGVVHSNTVNAFDDAVPHGHQPPMYVFDLLAANNLDSAFDDAVPNGHEPPELICLLLWRLAKYDPTIQELEMLPPTPNLPYLCDVYEIAKYMDNLAMPRTPPGRYPFHLHTVEVKHFLSEYAYLLFNKYIWGGLRHVAYMEYPENGNADAADHMRRFFSVLYRVDNQYLSPAPPKSISLIRRLFAKTPIVPIRQKAHQLVHHYAHNYARFAKRCADDIEASEEIIIELCDVLNLLKKHAEDYEKKFLSDKSLSLHLTQFARNKKRKLARIRIDTRHISANYLLPPFPEIASADIPI